MYLFLPFMAAALYGLGYILIERLLKGVSIVSYMTLNSIFFTAILLILSVIRREEGMFSIFLEKNTASLFLAALFVNASAWIMTLLSLKNNSAVYTSFAEISYPLFVVIFLFLIFGIRQWNGMTLLGGAVIFFGSLIIIAAQIKLKDNNL